MTPLYYEAVPVEKELPKESGTYFVIANSARCAGYLDKNKNWFESKDNWHQFPLPLVTHWLRPITGEGVSDDEIKKAAHDECHPAAYSADEQAQWINGANWMRSRYGHEAVGVADEINIDARELTHIEFLKLLMSPDGFLAKGINVHLKNGGMTIEEMSVSRQPLTEREAVWFAEWLADRSPVLVPPNRTWYDEKTDSFYTTSELFTLYKKENP